MSLVSLLVLQTAQAGADACPGNCNGDASVAVDEIVVGVNIALGHVPLSVCPVFDRDANEDVRVDELISAIDSLLRGCPAVSSPTVPPAATSTPSPTPTETATPTRPAGRVEIQGRLQVFGDFFAEGAGERQTVLGDCNADGRLDAVRLQWNTHAPPQLLVQDEAGAFIPAELHEDLPFGSGTFADIDGDRMQDLLLAYNDVVVLAGHGDCTFDEPRSIGRVCDFPIVQTLVTDIDLDGLADVSLSCIGSKPTGILLARGDGDFELVPSEPAVPSDSGYAMFGILYDDFDDDGTRDLLMMVDTEKSWFSWGNPGDVPHYSIDEALTEAIYPTNPMGVALLDYDRDGKIEYFLSGTRTNPLFRKDGGRNLVDVAVAAGVAFNTDATSFSPYAFDANLDGWTDLLVIRRGGYRPEDEHPVLPYMFINQRVGYFRDEKQNTIDTPIISTMMNCGDLASDGRVGCFAGDGRGTFLLLNAIEPEGNWVGLRLRGTVSSPEASGAFVALEGAVPPQVVATGQSPAWGDHARDVLLAIGDRTSAPVRITWPSGIVQRMEDLPAGTYTTIVEPEALTVSARVAPADGETIVEVVVHLDAVGAASASIERDGAGSWLGPASASGTLLRRQLRAPEQPGSARIRVELDGTTLLVRPRVRFESQP